MRFFDLHCDTLYKAITENTSLDEDGYEVSVSRGKTFDKWRQCAAIWIPDGISQPEAIRLFTDSYNLLRSEADRLALPLNSFDNIADHSLIFTVENGTLIGCDLDNVDLLKRCGVRMLTLTWNGENSIGGGADVQEVGLTEFGKLCLKKLEDNSVVIDVSHASDRLFYDVIENTKKPLAASHSNSRSVCDHRRNLTDEQFSIIRDRGGVVGLNFHREFLSQNSCDASIKDLLLHAEHFLSLGGENTLCIGSDFDGSDVPQDLNGFEKIPVLADAFLKIGYNEQLVQKILYDNAYNFFSRF